MPRIVLAAPTHRHYTYPWVRGVVSLGWPEPDVAARLDRLQVDVRPAVGAGYGAARNMGDMVASAVAQGAEYLLTCEWDHAWDARHVCQVVEAESFLRKTYGCPVVVGAMYPGSATPFVDVVRPLASESSFTTRDVADRMLIAAESMRDAPDAPGRYVEAWMMPAGFTLWPVDPLRGVEIEERCGPSRAEYWDAQASALCAAAGCRLFVDLSLDVGHVPAVGLSSLDVAKLRRGG